MNVLVINCGSSSIKADVLDEESGARLRCLRIERVGTARCTAHLDDLLPKPLGHIGHSAALSLMLPALVSSAPVAAVGHRVVHGGARFSAPTRIDAAVERAIAALVPLAPLHQPHNLAGIPSGVQPRDERYFRLCGRPRAALTGTGADWHNKLNLVFQSK